MGKQNFPTLGTFSNHRFYQRRSIMEHEMTFGMGWLPDIPSIKDYHENHDAVAPLLAQTSLRSRLQTTRGTMASTPATGKGSGAATAARMGLQPTVDLRPFFSPIENQGQLGSCTANAAVALVEYFERKAFNTYLDASRLFVYKTTRNLLGWTGDRGAYIRSAMGALVLFGSPPERYWPYDGRPSSQNTRFDQEPSAFCYAFASNYQSIKYLRLDTANVTPSQLLDNIKTYLSAGFPCMFGFPVYQEFMTPDSQGHVAFPSPNSTFFGGHAIVAAGYDNNITVGADKGALLVRNSWGTSWGLQGYAWLSYRYVTEALAVDWWTLIKNKWVDTGKF